MGEAAGVAAALSVKAGVAPRQLSVALLRDINGARCIRVEEVEYREEEQVTKVIIPSIHKSRHPVIVHFGIPCIWMA